MKWKITLQFLISLIIIGVAINFINTAVTSYYFYKAAGDGGVDIARIGVLMKSGPFDISTFTKEVHVENGKPAIAPDTIDKLKKADGWVQFMDKDGKVIESINKPADMQTINTPDGIISFMKKSDANVKYSIFIKGSGGAPKDQLRYVVGLPRPEFSAATVFYSLFSYFAIWNEPKLITMALTVLTVLLLGYFFGISLSKPVVKVIDGITVMAGGDYRCTYPEAGLYKDVYMSLNHLARNLQSSELERSKVERMREEWIMNITHDLKTPLSSIKGYAELLMEPAYELVPDERKKYSEVILNKSNYMEILLEDLKLTHKLKNGLLPVNKTAGNLVEALRDVVISILNDPRYEQRKINFEPAEENLVLNFDQMLMQRAFTNIIYNAVVHNPEDTVLWVKVHKKDNIYIEVEDNGRGIPEEDLDSLFERYYRGTNTEASSSGSGLGLAIAKQIIEAHGGKVDLESESGEGTRVRVIF